MSVRRRRVLYVCHGHPSVSPGGAECYALELHEAMRAASKKFEPVLLAHAAPAAAALSSSRLGARLAPIPGSDATQIFFVSDRSNYDTFTGRSRDARSVMELFKDLLCDLRPDVIHFQHTLFLGYELIGAARRALPHVPLVYTLHEFLPICHHAGQMLRTHDHQPCSKPTAQDCSRCFPGIAPSEFFLRQRYIQSQFEMVDQFLSPSQFLRDRYIEWGLHPQRIRVEELGRLPATPVEDSLPEKQRRNTLGFFGQLTPFKGADVLLKAMRALAEQRSPARLRMHGANLERQRPAFQKQLRALLAEAGESVTDVGSYRRDELPRLMAEVDWVVVPSIWWENSPLVIQEAYQHGRPVICSDIGGMAEKVTHGVNGLHFRA
jgi:glycosyltransferase involved in cell wall biosynthesis